jgi:hypothetical protein
MASSANTAQPHNIVLNSPSQAFIAFLLESALHTIGT